MGLLDSLFKQTNGIIVGAAIEGKCIDLKEVPDEAFSTEVLGKGVGIVPANGKVYAPVDGVVTVLFPTKHAVVITTAEGAEILIHVGLDTVSLKGEPFTVHVQADDKVKKGDLLIEADLDLIKEANLSTVTPMVLCNPDDFSEIECFTGNEVVVGNEVIRIKRK